MAVARVLCRIGTRRARRGATQDGWGRNASMRAADTTAVRAAVAVSTLRRRPTTAASDATRELAGGDQSLLIAIFVVITITVVVGERAHSSSASSWTESGLSATTTGRSSWLTAPGTLRTV